MTGKGEKRGERIDLGLEALLSHSQESREVQGSVDAGGVPTPRDSWTLGSSAQTEKSEYDALADDKKWGEIVRRAEARLAEGDDLEAKVWWVRGHLGAFSMPVSFLAAPLNMVLRSLSKSAMAPSVASIVKETGLLALSRLREVEDTGQFEEMKSALDGLGIHEPKNPRERKRTGTSSFRPSDILDQQSGMGAGAAPDQGREGLSLTAWLLFTLGVVILLGGGAAALLGLDFFTSPLKTAREGFVSGPLSLEQVVTVPAPKDPSGRLGALFYSINGENEGIVPPVPAQSPLAGGTPNEELSVTGEKKGEKDDPPQKQKERINTAGPQETAEFRERRERSTARESGGGRAGRESPRPALPSARDGAFSNERTYSVLSRTPVLSAPSFGGKEIGSLERGDRVLVEGKLGRWLRLRSRKGRGGYVLAQDVEEVSDDELPTKGAR